MLRMQMKVPCLIVEATDADQHRLLNIVSAAVPVESLCVTTIEDARAAVSTYRFDLILLDNALPDGNGVNFAQELRSMPPYRTTPVVLFSDWSTPFMQEKAQLARVNVMVQKMEFHPSHVRDVLRYARVKQGSRQIPVSRPPESAV